MHGHLAFLGLFWDVLLSDDCSDDSASVSERGIARGDTPEDIPVRLKMDTCNKLGFSVGVGTKQKALSLPEKGTKPKAHSLPEKGTFKVPPSH